MKKNRRRNFYCPNCKSKKKFMYVRKEDGFLVWMCLGDACLYQILTSSIRPGIFSIAVVAATLASCTFTKNILQGWDDTPKCYYDVQGNRTVKYCDKGAN